MTTPDSADRLATILEKVRAIGPTLRARAPEAERAARLSDETIADLDATGAFNIASPAEFGGDELSVREQLEVVIEVSKWDGSCGWVVWAGASINWITRRIGFARTRGGLRTGMGRTARRGIEPLPGIPRSCQAS